MALGPITSPWEFSFGVNGESLSGSVTFDEATRRIQSASVTLSANLTAYAGLVINGREVARPPRGGSRNVNRAALNGVGLVVIEDVVSISLVA